MQTIRIEKRDPRVPTPNANPIRLYAAGPVFSEGGQVCLATGLKVDLSGRMTKVERVGKCPLPVGHIDIEGELHLCYGISSYESLCEIINNAGDNLAENPIAELTVFSVDKPTIRFVEMVDGKRRIVGEPSESSNKSEDTES